MPLIRNVSGRDLQVPWLGRLVFDEQTVDVPTDTVFAYTQQEQTWTPADDAAQAVHDEALEAIAVLIGAPTPEPKRKAAKKAATPNDPATGSGNNSQEG